MNIEFMKDYYQLKYPDTFLLHAIEEYKKCRELYSEIMRLEGEAENVMRSMGKEALMLHGKLFSLRGEMDELMIWLAYLQGAEDREKMLR